MWHVACGMRHVACGMWHVGCGTQWDKHVGRARGHAPAMWVCCGHVGRACWAGTWRGLMESIDALGKHADEWASKDGTRGEL